MTQPTWLIEANVEGLPSEQLQAVIQRQGMSACVVKPYFDATVPRDILGAEDIPLDACIVFTGTLTLMKHIQQNRKWLPGGWCNFKNLACSTYYAYFGSFLLNRNYTMLPVAEALREYNRLFTAFGRENQVFVRPDSVAKSFSGKLVDAEAFESVLRQQSLDPTSMIVVAEPRQLGHEWRLFIAHGKAITGSQYRVSGETSVAAGVPGSVVQFANEVLASVAWRPDPLFVMDVCECDEGLRIVELNSFSCSGQCAADLDVYVSAASRCASLCW